MCLLVAFYGLMPNIKVIFGMLFLFWVAVALASDSLLSPKGVNYEGEFQAAIATFANCYIFL